MHLCIETTIGPFHVCRGVSSETDDIIRASATALGKNGFINYFGLQVILWSINAISLPVSILLSHLISRFEK